MTAVRVIVCRVGLPPTVQQLAADEHGDHLPAMQAIVGGHIELLALEGGLDLWCNEDALGLQLPLNVIIPALAPEVPAGVELLTLGDELARPGELGAWRIHGDFFVARSRGDDVADVTDEDIAAWTAAWLRSQRPQGAAPAQLSPRRS